MVFPFENSDYFKICEGHLESKITIKVQVYDDIYPMKCMGKQLIRLAGQNFGCHKTHHFKPKLVLQVEQTT